MTPLDTVLCAAHPDNNIAKQRILVMLIHMLSTRILTVVYLWNNASVLTSFNLDLT